MLTRRAFIRLTCLFPLALSLDAKEIAGHSVEVRDVLMGTFVQIKGIGVGKPFLAGIIGYMKRLEYRFTRFNSESELSAFNREGAVRRPSEEFRKVMETARDAYEQTGRAFDVTILPALRQLEKHRQPLTEEEKARIRERMGPDDIEVSRDVIYSPKRVQITLDGIAKGYVIDKGIERMREAGAEQVLVNIGGDMYCGPHGRGWSVGIYDPFSDSLSRKLRVEQAAVCTSGGYVNYYSEDRRIHHIIDPASLSSPNHAASVTVISSTACRADLLSTALFVTGPKGRDFLRDGERAYFIV